MKGTIFALATLLSSASAGIHKMPLKKVSLTEQLAAANIDTHVKHLGQKYMGVRPQSHEDEMFKATVVDAEGQDHTVPVSNFLNAQCKSFIKYSFHMSNCTGRLLRDLYWNTPSNLQGRS